MHQNIFVKLLFMFFSYFTPIASLIHVVLVFIFIDAVSGVYASFRNNEIVVSHRLRKTIEKFVFYSLAIIVAYVFQKEIFSYINLTQLVSGFIASIELLSIYENIKRVTKLDLTDKVKQYLKSMFKNNN